MNNSPGQGTVKMAVLGDLIFLVRNVGLNSQGGLDQSTLEVTKLIDLPHHQGAGGRSNFVSDKAYDNHIKLNARWKAKRAKNKNKQS